MKNIHFSLIQSNYALRRDLTIIGHLKRYLINKHIPTEITYSLIPSKLTIPSNRYSETLTHVNISPYGKSCTNFVDLDKVIIMVNNYNSGKDLLHGLNICKEKMELIETINKTYNNIDKYQTIAFSIFEVFLFFTFYTMLLIKRKRPDINIIVGGFQLESDPLFVSLCHEFDFIDYVIVGDVETGIEDYINGNILKNTIHYPENVDMDLIHPPIYDTKDLYIVGNKISTITSRGCVCKCKYCVSTLYKFRTTSIDAILETFKHYQNKSAEIYLNDCEFNYSKKKTLSLLNALIKIKNKRLITGDVIEKNLDEEIIRKLSLVNYNVFSMGIDCVGRDVKKIYGITKWDHDTLPETIRIINKYNGNCRLMSVVCLPEETNEDFEYSLEYLGYLSRTYDTTVILYPYVHHAGSHVHNNPDKYNITYSYWDEQDIIVNSDALNKIITKIPRYYYCNITRDEYMTKFKVIQKFLETNTPRYSYI